MYQYIFSQRAKISVEISRNVFPSASEITVKYSMVLTLSTSGSQLLPKCNSYHKVYILEKHKAF